MAEIRGVLRNCELFTPVSDTFRPAVHCKMAVRGADGRTARSAALEKFSDSSQTKIDCFKGWQAPLTLVSMPTPPKATLENRFLILTTPESYTKSQFLSQNPSRLEIQSWLVSKSDSAC